MPLLLAAATLVPIGALGWMSVRILQQDRAIETQRRADFLRLAGRRVALEADQKLAAIEDQLAQADGIQFTKDGLGPGVLYQPEIDRVGGSPAVLFAEAEELEFRQNDLDAARKEYARLAESADPPVRAGALVRLGRVLRGQNHPDEALSVYAQLQELGSVAVAGQPAEMVARQVRYRLSKTPADQDAFRDALYSGGIKMDRPTFEFYRDMLEEWGGPAPPPGEVVRTEAALTLWRRWKASGLPERGRELISYTGGRALAIWTGGQEQPTARVLTLPELESHVTPLAEAAGLQVSLTGGPPPDGAVVLTSGETGLPFGLEVSAAGGFAAQGDFGSGRTALIVGLAITFALMLAAAYGLYRATTREMALADQQADFVSAVSHEFRTPLTSMRHLTELLATGSAPSEDRKVQYYQLLAQETERLHQMVESLLSFGRMQAGSYAWKLEPMNPRELLDDAVAEFRRQPQSSGREVLSDVDEDLPQIQADSEALSRAVLNLIDNAGKYSETGTPIRVSARRNGDSVEIAVEDQGAGIPPDQQKKLFDKFARGDEARRAGVRGIGVGLALVKSVAEAHGGSVRLVSEPGGGSTFTLVIPCHES